MNQILSAALRYRRRGWSVIPVRRGGPDNGQPLIKWRQYQERPPTEEEIRQWWEQFPTANVALVTGKVSGVVAFDVDTRKGGDPNEVWKQRPTGLASATGGGGAHLLYRYPESGSVFGGDSKGAVEVKGDGATITLPPSIHPSGQKYRWVARGEPADFIPIEVHRNGKHLPNGNGRGSPEPWVAELLSTPLREGDGRNNAATRLAGYFIRKGMPADIVRETLNNWDRNNIPPLGDGTIEVIVDSVKKTSERRAPHTHITIPASSTDEPFALLKLGTYMSKFGDAPVSWAVENWLPDETIAMAVAPPGTYKTWLELALAVSVASGKPFLGQYQIHRPGPVIIIQQEDYHGQMAERLAVIVGSQFDYGLTGGEDNYRFMPPPDLPIYLHPDRRFRFDDQIVVDSLAEKIKKIKPALVIIDPLYSAGNVDDFGARMVQEMWPLKQMRDAFNCGFFISHHTTKRAGETDREDAWGIQFLNAFIETGWQIRRRDEVNSAKIRRHFKVRQDIEEQVLRVDISTSKPYKFDIRVREATAKDKKEVDILDFLTTNGPAAQADLPKLLGVDKSTISRKLDNLKKSGMVQVLNGLLVPEAFSLTE